MKIKIKSKKIFTSPLYTFASRFEKNELFVGLSGVGLVFLACGFILYFIVLSGLKTEVSVSIREVKIKKEILEDVLLDLENKTKVPPQSVVVDPFQ